MILPTALGPYQVVDKLGEGGPPPFARRRLSANYGEISPKPSRA